RVARRVRGRDEELQAAVRIGLEPPGRGDRKAPPQDDALAQGQGAAEAVVGPAVAAGTEVHEGEALDEAAGTAGPTITDEGSRPSDVRAAGTPAVLRLRLCQHQCQPD